MKRKNRAWLARAIRYASAKTFALHMMPFDSVVMGVLALLAGGAVYLQAAGDEPVGRLLAAFVACCATKAMLVILRSFIPFVLRLSFANMLRLRVPFYLWGAAVFLTALLASPVRRLFASCSAESVQMTLILVAVAFVIRFFQTGASLRLVVAFSCAGMALGISVAGVLAPVAIWITIRRMADGVFAPDEGYGWKDEPNEAVAEFFMNPLVRSRMRWIFCLFFACGFLLAVWRVFLPDGHFPGFRAMGIGWLAGYNVIDIIVVLTMVAFPLFLVLGRVAYVSDANAELTLSEMMPHFLVGAVSILFLLRPRFLTMVLGLVLGVNDLVKVLVILTGGFDILVSAAVLLIDIRCRDFEDNEGRSDVFLRQMRFTYVLASVAPVLLAGAVVFLSLRRSGSFPFSLGALFPAEEEREVEMVLSPKEAMRIAEERNNMVLAERYARQVVSENPVDVEANSLLARRYFESGLPKDAESLADRVLAAAPEDVDVLNLVVGVYEKCGNTNKLERARGRIAAVRAKAN